MEKDPERGDSMYKGPVVKEITMTVELWEAQHARDLGIV